MSTVFQLRGEFETAYRTSWATYLAHFTPAIFGQRSAFSPADQVEIALCGLARAAERWTTLPGARPRRGPSFAKRFGPAARGPGAPADALREDAVLLFERCTQGQMIHHAQRIELPAELVPLRQALQLHGLRHGAADAYQTVFPRSTVLAVLDDLLREAKGTLLATAV